jgi:hypothetical protein
VIRSLLLSRVRRALGAAAPAVFVALGAALAPAPALADSVTLTWTATGDDGTVGRATTYELRFSEQPVVNADTVSWWSSASTAGTLPPPATSGTRESYTMSGLTTGSTYYFVLRVADEAGNWSGFSNVDPRQAGTAGVLATPSGFSANLISGGVDLSWAEPASGSGSGYHIYRGVGSGSDTLLTSLAVGATAWCDTTAAGGVAYEYKLATFQGTGEGVPAIVSISVPSDRLASAKRGLHGYPNPARGKVTLRFAVGAAGGPPERVKIVIYDLTGHKVCDLVDRELPAGEQAIDWGLRSDRGMQVAPGIYNAILDGPQGRNVTRIAVVP